MRTFLLLAIFVMLLATSCGEVAGLEPLQDVVPDEDNLFKNASGVTASTPTGNPFNTNGTTGSKTSSKSDNTKNPPGVTVTEILPGDSVEKAIKVSAKSLYNDRDSNPVRFSEKYGRPFGMWLRITGTVKGIGKDAISLRELSIGLGLSTRFGVLVVEDGPKGRELVLSATAGKLITAICLMNEKTDDVRPYYRFEKCQVP